MDRRLRWFVLLGLMLVIPSSSAMAECGTCQICEHRTVITLAQDFCRAANNEDGFMCCQPQVIGPQTFCSMSGSACYGIVVGGGGGGGTGGGAGGGCRYQNGWCPAECWSCNGGAT